MKVVEAQDIINSLYKQITQKTDITAVDNTSLVDMGKTLQTGAYSREEIYNTIIDKVGQTVLRNRLFAVKFPKIFRSEQEFGSILETLRFKRVPAEKSEIYNTKAGSYQQDDYTPMEVEAKYFTDYADYRYSFWKPMGDQLSFTMQKAMEPRTIWPWQRRLSTRIVKIWKLNPLRKFNVQN